MRGDFPCLNHLHLAYSERGSEYFNHFVSICCSFNSIDVSHDRIPFSYRVPLGKHLVIEERGADLLPVIEKRQLLLGKVKGHKPIVNNLADARFFNGEGRNLTVEEDLYHIGVVDPSDAQKLTELQNCVSLVRIRDIGKGENSKRGILVFHIVHNKVHEVPRTSRLTIVIWHHIIF